MPPQTAAAPQQANPQTVLDPLKAPDSVKADAWDAYHAASDSADFQRRFSNVAIPDSAKAELWDMKFSGMGGGAGGSWTPEQPGLLDQGKQLLQRVLSEAAPVGHYIEGAYETGVKPLLHPGAAYNAVANLPEQTYNELKQGHMPDWLAMVASPTTAITNALERAREAGAANPQHPAMAAAGAAVPFGFGQPLETAAKGEYARAAGQATGEIAPFLIGGEGESGERAGSGVGERPAPEPPVTATEAVRGVSKAGGFSKDIVSDYGIKMVNAASNRLKGLLDRAVGNARTQIGQDVNRIVAADEMDNTARYAKAGAKGAPIDLGPAWQSLVEQTAAVNKLARKLPHVEAVENLLASIPDVRIDWNTAKELRTRVGQIWDSIADNDRARPESHVLQVVYKHLTRQMAKRAAELGKSAEFDRYNTLTQALRGQPGQLLDELRQSTDGRSLAKILGDKFSVEQLRRAMRGLEDYGLDKDQAKELLGRARGVLDYAKSSGLGNFMQRFQIEMVMPVGGRYAGWLGLPLWQRAKAAAQAAGIERAVEPADIEAAVGPSIPAPTGTPEASTAARIEQIRRMNRPGIGAGVANTVQLLNKAERAARQPRNLARAAIAARIAQQRNQ